LERERWEREKEEKDKVRAYNLKMRELGGQVDPPHSDSKFDIAKNIRLVPPFKEAEIDKYFLLFEKVAQNLKWPKEHWVLLLQSVLTGKASEIYTELSIEQSSDYDQVKSLILKAYELVPEAYRLKFRSYRKDTNQTYVEFSRIKEQMLDRWCRAKKVGDDFEKMKQLILVEEFKRCIDQNIKVFLDERQIDNLHEAAKLADDYA
jgi:hypothetical protein